MCSLDMSSRISPDPVIDGRAILKLPTVVVGSKNAIRAIENGPPLSLS